MKAVLALLGALLGGWLILNLIGALVVGALARAILPGKDKVGWPLTITLGFLGGLFGKLVAFLIGWRDLGMFRGFLVSVAGAIALLVAHRIWSASNSSSRATKV